MLQYYRFKKRYENKFYINKGEKSIMKSKLLASLLIVMAMLCVFAFGASAATEISTADQLLDLILGEDLLRLDGDIFPVRK